MVKPESSAIFLSAQFMTMYTHGRMTELGRFLLIRLKMRYLFIDKCRKLGLQLQCSNFQNHLA